MEQDVPMLVMLKGAKEDDPETSSKQMMHLKLLVLGDEQSPGNVRVEITSEDDIFFQYIGK